MADFSNLKTILLDTAYEAGDAIMEIYSAQSKKFEYKNDNSPVTKADQRAEAVIIEALSKSYYGTPIIAEEAVSCGNVPSIEGSSFFLVDALDGTKEFINGRSDFTVNIALIREACPVAGIVYAPVHKTAWVGIDRLAEKISNEERPDEVVRVSEQQAKGKRVVVSHSHNNEETEAYLAKLEIAERMSCGSSMKFCMVAEGSADVYPRFGRTMEWDTAAGDAVLRAAGGRTLTIDQKPLEYGKRNQAHYNDFANPFFVADSSC